MSQEELADRAAVNRNYVGMLEREEYAASVDMLEKLAAGLDIDAIEFLRPGDRKAESAAPEQSSDVNGSS